MQSGKFFSNEVLKNLEVLKESSPQVQVDEAPLGVGAGLAARLGTMMPGQSTRAQARGKLEAGKVANNLYQNYYQWLGRNKLQPSEKTIIDFLSANKIPTGNAQTALIPKQPAPKKTKPAPTSAPNQPLADPNSPQKGTFTAPDLASSRDLIDKMEKPQVPYPQGPAPEVNVVQPQAPYPRPDEKTKIINPQAPSNVEPAPTQPQTQAQLRNKAQIDQQKKDASKKPVPIPEELDDILKLSGIREFIFEKLSNQQISAAFMAAAGEFLDKGYAELPPVAAAPPGQTASASAGGSSSTGASAPSTSGGSTATAGSGSGGASTGSSSSASTSSNPFEEFKTWLERNKGNQKVLNRAKKELENTIKTSFANQPIAQTQAQAPAGVVGTNPTPSTKPAP